MKKKILSLSSNQRAAKALGLTKKILDLVDVSGVSMEDARSALHAADALLPASDPFPLEGRLI